MKYEKETGIYWSGDENSDANTYHSNDNENVLVGNETGPILLRFFRFLVDLLEKCVKISALMKKRKLSFTCLTELKIKDQIFSTSIYLQIITNILRQ